MKFTKEFLQDMGGNTISDELVDHRRWSVLHKRVFEYAGRFYVTHYSVGATESQDESPYEYDDDVIEVQEVVPVQRMVTVYEPAPAEPRP